jgi:hypothetical protein
MKAPVIALILIAASSSPHFAQERPVPKDSTRLSISGCARGRVFTVDRNPEHEVGSTILEYGTKARLQGPKKLLDEIKARERSMIELTGLIKLSEVTQPGVGLAGGRVRIAPASPMGRGGVPVDTGPQPPVIDVESWRLLNASCPSR